MLRAVLAVAAYCVLGCASTGRTPTPTTNEAPPAPAPAVEASSPAPSGPLSSDEVEQTKKEMAALPPMAEVRPLFRTKLVSRGPEAGAADVPPAGAPFALVKYAAEPGELSAYVTQDPGDGKRHPAIIWITGGDTNSIGDMWSPAHASNDQTAAAYRKAGLVMMIPSQRGGNDNPGQREGFLGEVEDVVAARAHLAALPYVDPERIYLGGHSTGGTLALLVAETTDRFRAVFSFGPVAHVAGYGDQFVYYDPADDDEMAMRSPGLWLKDIRTPTFVFEGSDGNVDDLRMMQQLNENPLVRLFVVNGASHFSILAPTNALIASKLVADVGAAVRISFDTTELARPFAPPATR